jgi:hypothetical protein
VQRTVRVAHAACTPEHEDAPSVRAPPSNAVLAQASEARTLSASRLRPPRCSASASVSCSQVQRPPSAVVRSCVRLYACVFARACLCVLMRVCASASGRVHQSVWASGGRSFTVTPIASSTESVGSMCMYPCRREPTVSPTIHEPTGYWSKLELATPCCGNVPLRVEAAGAAVRSTTWRSAR